MVGDHEAAGAIPVIPTRFLHATVPRNGTRFCEDRRQRFNSSRWHVSLLRRTVWDGTGFQPRSSSVRFAGGVLRLFALPSVRAAVWCDSR